MTLGLRIAVLLLHVLCLGHCGPLTQLPSTVWDLVGLPRSRQCKVLLADYLGLYSWFLHYDQSCLDQTGGCQKKFVQIEQTMDIWLYNLITKRAVEMVSPVGEIPTYAEDNVNGFMSSDLAWVRREDNIVGQRDFKGFRVYREDALSGLSPPCVTALTQDIECHPYLYMFQHPSVHGSLRNDTLMDLVCDSGCGDSL